jgi:two-component system chemotaxis response regulator CheB
LQTVLKAIPSHFPAPILVVQHMPPNFTKSLADRLNSICELIVVEAEDNMAISPGTVYIAPGGYHMQASRALSGTYRIQLTKGEPQSGHRPSVDKLFESIVPLKELDRYAVIMTGMGSDGANGILALKKSGAKCTIAESEETCIVYGMPRAAVELQAIDYVLKLQDIPLHLNKMINRNT